MCYNEIVLKRQSKRGDKVNKNLLKSFMVLNGDTQERLADALGISLSNLNAKMNSKGASFRQTEIMEIKERYKLTADDVDGIFFNIELS